MGGWVTEIQVSDADDVTYIGRTSAKKKKKLSSTRPLTGLSFSSDTYFVSVADPISLNVYIPFTNTLLSPTPFPKSISPPIHPQSHDHPPTLAPRNPYATPLSSSYFPFPKSLQNQLPPSPLCGRLHISHSHHPCHLDFLKIAHSSRTQPRRGDDQPRQRSPKIDNDVSKRCNRYPSSVTPIRDLLAHHLSHSERTS